MYSSPTFGRSARPSIRSSALKRDHAWNGIGSSVLWDPDAKWVVVVSGEGHGVIAGSSAFVAALQDRLPHGGESVGEIARLCTSGHPRRATQTSASFR